MRALAYFATILVFSIGCMGCEKEDDNSNNNSNNNNNSEIPDTKVTITASEGGNQLDQTVVEIINSQIQPSGWGVTAGYNSAANIFAFNVLKTGGTQIDYNLNITKSIPAFAEGSFSIATDPNTISVTSYKNVNVHASEVYQSTSGTFTIDKLEVIGSAGGASANYIDGSFNFTARGMSDTTDVIMVQGTFTGMPAPKQ